jgi:hypothetical protein
MAISSEGTTQEVPLLDSQSTAASLNNTFAGALNFYNSLANTVISDILQNIDQETVTEQIH